MAFVRLNQSPYEATNDQAALSPQTPTPLEFSLRNERDQVREATKTALKDSTFWKDMAEMQEAEVQRLSPGEPGFLDQIPQRWDKTIPSDESDFWDMILDVVYEKYGRRLELVAEKLTQMEKDEKDKDNEIVRLTKLESVLKEKDNEISSLKTMHMDRLVKAHPELHRMKRDGVKTVTEAILVNTWITCKLQGDRIREVVKAHKDLEKVLNKRDVKVGELNKKITSLNKRLEEMESGVRCRERDVKLREDAVKTREQELKSQPRKAKELTNDSGKELKAARAQIREAEGKIVDLEKKLKSAADDHNILKLDYDASLSELEALKANDANADPKHSQKTREQFRKLKEDRDKFKGLYEANRSSEKTMQDRITKAVRTAEAKQNATFEAWKARTQQVAQETVQKLEITEAKAEAAEQLASETRVAAEARISEVLKDTDERIKDLSRAKLGLAAENSDKDTEIEQLKQQLAALSLSKAEK
jgi:chromosome segregation ATPase